MTMTQHGMAEARPDTPKKYTCACGLSQEDRKSKFSGKCRHCHTRAKYLRGQSSFDSGSASRGWATGSPGGSTGSSPNNSSSSSSSTANNSDGDGGNSSSSSRSSSSSGGSAGAAGSNTSNRLVRQVSVSETRRRSRSVDRYDGHRITDPPPYSWVATGNRSRDEARETGRGRGSSAPVRRAESEDSAGARRAAQLVTPPPPYEVAQNQTYYQLPPSYEEALANTMTGASISTSVRETPPPTSTASSSIAHPNLASIVSSTVPILPVPTIPSRSSRVLEEQAAVLEAQREAQVESQRLAQRDAQREAQIELERDMERQRLRELQLAQYCGCAKCQGYYYSYYYDDAMNDGGAFPMETQVLMQEVLTDGLAFCSIM